ncbi:MAG TPA: cation-translocating P-type ATPase, partial [Verrucomicrobiota bacterium]|nr:cation-translocating P-type ATPase [Verrucomicrobiota bacterium]
VASATVDLPAGRLVVRWRPDAAAGPAAVIAAVTAAGYAAQEAATGDTPPRDKSVRKSWRLWLGGGVTLMLMLGEWALGLGHARWFQWLGFALALPVQVLLGAAFYVGAWRQLRRGASNMDTLVALGSTAAFGFSVWVLLAGAGGHVFFMEAAAILTLITLGHALEAAASARAGDALQALMQLAPDTARRLEGLAEREVPVAKLRPGDRIALRPGDRVPVDGEVAAGAGAVNEAMLTGESEPVEKAAGAQVFAGTENLDGRLVVRVMATGEATALAAIRAAIERAQHSRAGIQRLADQVSSVFVPVVILIALATGLWWGLAYEHALGVHAALAGGLWRTAVPETPLAAGVIHAVAVLIIACPCAMGLATPAAIMAGVNAAARRGILTRDGAALEKAGRISTVAFDKTGTLTEGRFEVVRVTPGGEAAADLLVTAASLAAGSAHPVSRAIAAGANAATPSGRWRDWRELRGLGIEAVDAASGRRWRLGAPAWVMETAGAVPLNEDAPASLQVGKSAPADAGGYGAGTRVGLAVGHQVVGWIELADRPRPGAAGVVARLQAQSLRVVMLTGDQPAAAAAIAVQADIAPEDVRAGARPEDKAAAIAEWQAAGERVAFVGDGLNDGPALAQADLGLAVGGASDVARGAADLVLLRAPLAAPPQ